MDNKTVLIKSNIANHVLLEFLVELHRQDRMEFLDKPYLLPMGEPMVNPADVILRGINWLESKRGNEYWKEQFNALNQLQWMTT